MIDAIVLAGGRSRRMGRDKATLAVHGARQIDRVIGLLAPLEGRVVIARGGLASLGIERYDVLEVPDDPGLTGPIAGVVAAAPHVDADAVALIAVDMPAVNAALLERLAAMVRRTRRAGAVPVVDGRAQPLHAVVATTALPALARLARRGEGSLRRALGNLDVVPAGPDAWLDLDDGTFATDWDVPGDLPSDG